MIVYPDLMKMLSDRGITSYTVRKNKKIGQATWKVLTEGGHINTRTIDALCEMIGCQPGDFLQYIPTANDTSIAQTDPPALTSTDAPTHG